MFTESINMRIARKVAGNTLMVIAFLLAAYVGIWLMFVGGIVDIIDEVRDQTFESLAIAVGVVKIVFAGFAAVIAGAIPYFIGKELAK